MLDMNYNLIVMFARISQIFHITNLSILFKEVLTILGIYLKVRFFILSKKMRIYLKRI